MKPRLRWADIFAPDLARYVREAAIWEQGRAVGLAQGELQGRLALANELEEMFPDHKDGISQDDACRIRVRQVH
jgi:hypothetical protein